MPKLWNDLRRGARANGAALRLCVRMTLAGIVAYALALLFAFPQGYWAVFSAIIIMQASVGGSVKATIDRVIGTLGGAFAGGAVAYFTPHSDPVGVGIALLLALVPVSLLAALLPSFRIAPVTAVIVLLTPGAQQLGPVESAIYRIIEITLGCLVGLVTSVVVLPARAHSFVIDAASRMLGHLADLMSDWLAVLAGGSDRARIFQLQDDIRSGLARLEIAAVEARQERKTYLTAEFDPDPLVRAVFRLRHDLVMIGRVAADPLPEAVITPLRQPITDVSNATQQFLRDAATALRQRRPPPALARVDAVLEGFVEEITALRREGIVRGLNAEDAGRLFALGFALEQLRRDFDDFGDRVAECARAKSK
jgi:uncharacterized membrane protein YccC